MRRAVIETPLEDLAKLGPFRLPEALESFEVTHFFASTGDGCIGLGWLTFQSETNNVEGLACPGGFLNVESLSRSGNRHLVYFECRSVDLGRSGGEWPRVFGSIPTEFRDGRARMTYFGRAVELKKLFRLLHKLGVRTRILSLTDEKLDANSPLTTLTERQRHVLTAAYKMGYYDVPRRIDSERVATALGLDKSTVVEHLRKAEGRLLRQVVGA